MDWIKKHTDTVMVIGAIISSMLWMNGKFNAIHLHLDFITHELEKIKVALISH